MFRYNKSFSRISYIIYHFFSYVPIIISYLNTFVITTKVRNKLLEVVNNY